MKKIFSFLLPVAMVTTVFFACNDKTRDVDIKADVEKALKDDPMAANMTVEVKDGVVTLLGECMSDKSKEQCTMRVETVVGVKSVVNNCKVLKETVMTDDQLNTQLYDLSKNLPYIKIGSIDGVVSVAGGMTKKEWETLKTGIDKLKPKDYDTTMLNFQ